MIPAETIPFVIVLQFWYNLLLLVDLEGLLRTFPLWRPLGDEKALYLFITHFDLKLLGDNVSFATRWPGFWCISAQPPSVSSLKTLPSWTPVFLILWPHFAAAGTRSSWMWPKQARCLHLIKVTVFFYLCGKKILTESCIFHIGTIKCNKRKSNI